jgi:lipooligosaccharide transport system ATP-binding protein
VVDGIDLDIRSGECFGLLGPNGAGKSTTIRMILGLSPISAGELTVLDHPVPEGIRAVRARCGVVPQTDNLDVDLTVAANLRVYASYFGLKGPAVADRIGELLAFFQLESRRDANIDALSGGMQRRLSLARALINDPELVILDEPTTGLDPQARRLVWQQLRRLREEGRTLLLTTHYMEEAARLCDRLVVMDRGRILDLGSPSELVARHVEPQVIEVPTEQAGEPEVADLPGVRTVHAGDTAYLYTAEPQAVLDRLHAAGQTTHFHRPANLEDVFLRLTGHELAEG